MIRKAFGVTAVLFLLFALLIGIRPDWSASQHDRQENIIRAQRFIYDNTDTVRDVVVGSSLSCHLVMDSLPGLYNLSFAGLSIFDGLAIIEHKEALPSRLFVEMNVALKKQDKGFAASLFSPVLFTARRLMPSLQAEKQPVALFGNFCLQTVKRPRRSPVATETSHDTLRPISAESAGDSMSPGEVIRRKMLKIQFEDYSKVPDSGFVKERFTALKAVVERLERKGVTVVFFEMPVNEQLCNLPSATVVRNMFHRMFPIEKYGYIPMPPCSEFRTTDGVHLGPEEAVRFTHYFKDLRAAL